MARLAAVAVLVCLLAAAAAVVVTAQAPAASPKMAPLPAPPTKKPAAAAPSPLASPPAPVAETPAASPDLASGPAGAGFDALSPAAIGGVLTPASAPVSSEKSAAGAVHAAASFIALTGSVVAAAVLL